MPGIDETIPFRPVRIAVLTVSDSRSLDDDVSGATLVERAETAGHLIVDRKLVKDDRGDIRSTLEGWLARPDVEVILTTGGTGVTGRDVTPEAVLDVADKEITGFGEMFRWLSMQHIGTATIQSRALGATARGKYVFALPGSPGGCRDAWDEILVHQLDIRHQPCNFAELLPRLDET
ncbi:MAG: molybdenum cofactor biosynthesis protein B [Actinobacteria bacterium ATB1]|nr:molybdenum cofactor biosynthesis protein B [Actinobacteria bacterium ATB1]